jgi:hypothetical protein
MPNGGHRTARSGRLFSILATCVQTRRKGNPSEVLRRVARALSRVVVLGWLALVAYTLIASVRMESGWSIAPANLVLETILAAVAIGALWGLVFGLERIGHLEKELRAPGRRRE